MRDQAESEFLKKWRADGQAWAASHPNALRDFIANMHPGGSEDESMDYGSPPVHESASGYRDHDRSRTGQVEKLGLHEEVALRAALGTSAGKVSRVAGIVDGTLVVDMKRGESL